jgi:hypothetical protein
MNYRSSYAQKLRDPRWQKKRLEVMQANDFSCEICGDKESTLNIHHKQYLRGHEPWEYNKNQLSCLCEFCHEETHSNVDWLLAACSILPITGINQRDNIAFLIAGLMNIDVSNAKIATEDQKKFCLIGKSIAKNGLDYFLNKTTGGNNG